jgi:2-isopropylmalate synthase
MRPQDVGQPSARLVLGRHSGRHAVQSRCEALGFNLTPAELDHVYRGVVALSAHRKTIDDTDLKRIVDEFHATLTTAHRPGSHPESLGYGHGV